MSKKDKDKRPDAAREAESMQQARTMRARRCPSCKRAFLDEYSTTPIEVVTDTSRDPLVTFERLHDHWVDEDGKPNLRASLLAHADNAPHGRHIDEDDVERAMLWMYGTTPRLAVITLARLDQNQSARDLGRELGIDDHTAEKIVRHGLHTLHEAIADGKSAAMAV